MTIQSLTGKPLRHYAQDTVTKTRYVVLALENDDDTDKCTVVAIDSLASNIRAELVETINSAEAQSQANPWKVLERKCFMDFPNSNMLQVLKSLKQLKAVNSSQVAVSVIGDETMSPKEIANSIREYEKSKKAGSPSLKEASEFVSKSENKMNDLDSRVENLTTTVAELSSTVAKLVESLQNKD